MLGLKGRRDGFRLLLPKEFLYKDIEAKYSEILKQKKGYFRKPMPTIKKNRTEENAFPYPASENVYRSPVSAASLMDKTLNIEFRHSLGYLNYFMLFENFWYIYSRDMKYSDICHQFYVDIFNEIGEVYCKIELVDPIISGMDMLDLDFTQPVAQSSSFKMEFKYSDFNFKFI